MSDKSTRGVEQVYFRYSCSQNDGLETLVSPDSGNLDDYTKRDCESLEGIIWWKADTDTERESGGLVNDSLR